MNHELVTAIGNQLNSTSDFFTVYSVVAVILVFALGNVLSFIGRE